MPPRPPPRRVPFGGSLAEWGGWTRRRGGGGAREAGPVPRADGRAGSPLTGRVFLHKRAGRRTANNGPDWRLAFAKELGRRRGCLAPAERLFPGASPNYIDCTI